MLGWDSRNATHGKGQGVIGWFAGSFESVSFLDTFCGVLSGDLPQGVFACNGESFLRGTFSVLSVAIPCISRPCSPIYKWIETIWNYLQKFRNHLQILRETICNFLLGHWGGIRWNCNWHPAGPHSTCQDSDAWLLLSSFGFLVMSHGLMASWFSSSLAGRVRARAGAISNKSLHHQIIKATPVLYALTQTLTPQKSQGAVYVYIYRYIWTGHQFIKINIKHHTKHRHIKTWVKE